MEDWIEFGDGDELSDHLGGLPAEDCTGLLAGVAAAAPGLALAIQIENIDDYPGAEVEDDGSHNFDPIPADIEAIALVGSEPVSLPADDPLLLSPPAGKQYRFIFGATSSGLIPGARDATLIRIDSKTSTLGRDISPQEDGSVIVS